jgi:hypothetical protein
MSREETQRAAKKRHRVGHDITQVHFCSHSKQEVEQYYDELSCTCTKIQVSANKKMEALSNPDMLDIEESPEAPEDQVSAYEQLRLQYIQRNTRIFESLGLAGGARKLLHAPFQCESRSSKAEDEQDSEMDSDETGPAPPH